LKQNGFDLSQPFEPLAFARASEPVKPVVFEVEGGMGAATVTVTPELIV